jgi:hypothetical protein
LLAIKLVISTQNWLLKAVKSTDKFYKVQQLWQWILNANLIEHKPRAFCFVVWIAISSNRCLCVIMPMQTIQMPFRQIQATIPCKKSMDVKVFALVFYFSLSKTHKVGCNKIT